MDVEGRVGEDGECRTHPVIIILFQKLLSVCAIVRILWRGELTYPADLISVAGNMYASKWPVIDGW